MRHSAWILVLLIGFLAGRVDAGTVDPGGQVRYCDEDDCESPGPFAAQWIAERRTAQGGAFVGGLLDLLDESERQVFRAVVDIEYDTIESDPGYQALPNLLLVESEPGHSRYVVSLPPGQGEVPGVVFLHGFGGLMAPYVRALADSEVGRRCAILAPILDNQGHWWEDGLDLVEDVIINHLPPRVDPDRLYLVGLSNGAVGATLLGLGDPVGSRFRGLALVSGIGPMPESPSCGTDLLVIHGLRDGRFLPWDISDGVVAMRGLGSRVRQETLDGDHFLILADRIEAIAILAEWIGQIEGEVQR